MEFVAFLGNDKENWGQVVALLNHLPELEKAILIKSSKEFFPSADKTKIIQIDTTLPLTELTNKLKESLKKELSKEFEVALSLASGTGKEHMALISALISVPVGIKLVVFSTKGIEFLT